MLGTGRPIPPPDLPASPGDCGYSPPCPAAPTDCRPPPGSFLAAASPARVVSCDGGVVSHPVLRTKPNVYLYVCQDQVSYI